MAAQKRAYPANGDTRVPAVVRADGPRPPRLREGGRYAGIRNGKKMARRKPEARSAVAREAPSPCQPNPPDRSDREGSSRKTGLSEPLPYIDHKDQPLGGSLIAGTGIGETSAAWARGYDAPPSPAVWGSSK